MSDLSNMERLAEAQHRHDARGEPDSYWRLQAPLIDGAWYWVRYFGLFTEAEAPAQYKEACCAFYSVSFSGVPVAEVEILAPLAVADRSGIPALNGAARNSGAPDQPTAEFAHAYADQLMLRCLVPVEPAPQAVEAQAEVQVEPVAWMLEGSEVVEFDPQSYHAGDEWTPLYTAPQAQPADALDAAWSDLKVAFDIPDSKDWQDGDINQRVQFLLTMREANQQYCAELEAQLSARQAAPDAIGHVRIDSGEVHIYPRNRDAESSGLVDGQLVYAAAPPPPEREPLTDEQIEKLRKNTFSTDNPFCPCDRKTMQKAVWAAEPAHGIGATND